MAERHTMCARFTRAATAVLGVAAFVVVSAGSAAAADPTDALEPAVDCIVTNDDGSWTAVLGYTNSGRKTVTVPLGPDNKITPAREETIVPTRFAPGRQRGAGAVTIENGGSAVWHLGNENLKINSTSAKACPPPTEMPAEGNGTGIVVALGAAGVIGAVVVRRTRRRAPVPAMQEVGPHA